MKNANTPLTYSPPAPTASASEPCLVLSMHPYPLFAPGSNGSNGSGHHVFLIIVLVLLGCLPREYIDPDEGDAGPADTTRRTTCSDWMTRSSGRGSYSRRDRRGIRWMGNQARE
jgi:hypothetical protein